MKLLLPDHPRPAHAPLTFRLAVVAQALVPEPEPTSEQPAADTDRRDGNPARGHATPKNGRRVRSRSTDRVLHVRGDLP